MSIISLTSMNGCNSTQQDQWCDNSSSSEAALHWSSLLHGDDGLSVVCGCQ